MPQDAGLSERTVDEVEDDVSHAVYGNRLPGQIVRRAFVGRCEVARQDVVLLDDRWLRRSSPRRERADSDRHEHERQRVETPQLLSAEVLPHSPSLLAGAADLCRIQQPSHIRLRLSASTSASAAKRARARYPRSAVRPHRKGGVGMAGSLFRLEKDDGARAEPPTVSSAVRTRAPETAFTSARGRCAWSASGTMTPTSRLCLWSRTCRLDSRAK